MRTDKFTPDLQEITRRRDSPIMMIPKTSLVATAAIAARITIANIAYISRIIFELYSRTRTPTHTQRPSPPTPGGRIAN